MAKKVANTRRWSHTVKTVSTFPPEGLYTKDAETIARVMATRKVSAPQPDTAHGTMPHAPRLASGRSPASRAEAGKAEESR
jgi:hypothetical protein